MSSGSPGLGLWVRTKRLERGLKVKELAEQASVSASYIYAVEAGHRGSRFAELIRLARALDSTLVELWQQAKWED
ncbi:MAG: helix-turn-helix domain-containing protein [Bacilli bacterium]